MYKKIDSSNRDRLFTEKQYAWERQNEAWKEYASLKSTYSPRLDEMKREHDLLFETMKECFQKASSAFSAKNHDDAIYYSGQGKDCKSRLAGIVS